ncbi:MAG TPA: PDZ domain-containing protein [Pyrinomonadaceae bacterium]|nr:PDZ domain-containing protein [Pyrinomonadaceae bacterium]
MMRLALLMLFALMLASPEAAPAQQAPAAPPPPAAAPEAPEPFVATLPPFEGHNFLGVQVDEITRENMKDYGLSGEPRGVGVREVVKGSPAERAGLREKDVILRFDGEAVTSARKLVRLVEESAPEHAARLTILRGGSEQEVTATLGRREGFGPHPEGARLFSPDPEETRRWAEEWRKHGEEWQKRGEELREHLEEMQREHPGGFALLAGAGRRIGVGTSPLGKQLAEYFGVQHGVLVNSVESGSPADKAGLRAGDVVTEADGERVEDAGDLSRAINRKDEGEVTLTVVRDKQRRTVRVTPERRQPKAFTISPGAVHVAPPVVHVTPPRAPAAARPPRAPRVRPLLPRLRVTRGNVI